MIIKFSVFRDYEKAFIKANDAMMALLVASNLTVDHLNQYSGEEELLPGLFEKVPEIKRLNRTPNEAAVILKKSEAYLANMAVVYVLAVHQVYMDAVVVFLREYHYEVEGKNPDGELAAIDSENIYKAIEECCGSSFDADLLEQFSFVRRLRNRIVHYGGGPGSRLRREAGSMGGANQELWELRMGRSLNDLLSHEYIELTAKELMGALSLSRKIAIETQELIAAKVDRSIWASIAVSEYAEENSEGFKNIGQRSRRVKGYAREFYGGLNLTDF